MKRTPAPARPPPTRTVQLAAARTRGRRPRVRWSEPCGGTMLPAAEIRQEMRRSRTIHADFNQVRPADSSGVSSLTRHSCVSRVAILPHRKKRNIVELRHESSLILFISRQGERRVVNKHTYVIALTHYGLHPDTGRR